MRRPEFIARHGGMPAGWLGRVIASIMERETAAINQQAIALLDARAGEAVLDIGTGNGLSLRHLAHCVGEGTVVGVDHSPVMCRRAEDSNKSLIDEGPVSVVRACSDELPFETGHFDAAMSVHTVYFWDPAEPHVEEIARVLRPGGRLVLAFRPDSDPATSNFPTSVYKFRSRDEVANLVNSCGFENVRFDKGSNAEVLLHATRACC